MSEILTKVKEIASDQLGMADYEIDTKARICDELGADSLDFIEIIMSVEDEFNIEISDDDAEELFTINDIVGYVERRLS